MKISDGRINVLSMDIASKLVKNGQVDKEKEKVSMEIRRGMVFFLQNLEKIDQKAREKIKSIKRDIPEGSQEWDVLYRQYFNEEMNKM